MTFVALLVLSTAPAAVLAHGHQQSITATITSPTTGDTFSRLDTVSFAGAVTNSNCAPGSYEWKHGGTIFSTTTTATRQFSTLGDVTVSFRAEGASGACSKQSTASVTITIVNLAPAAALASAASVVAGETLVLDAGGSSDADGSVVSYTFFVDDAPSPSQASSTLGIQPTAAGTHTARVQVVDNNGASSLSAPISFEVLAGPVATIAVTPPNVAVAVEGTQSFTATGADAYGNPATFTPAWSATCGSIDAAGSYVAPSASGACIVTAASGAAWGNATVDVLAGPLAAISLAGPASVVAGTSARFALEGADAFGNAVALAQEALDWIAPDAAGPATVSYTESGVTGTLDVTVVAGPVARIVVSGPAELVAGTEGTYALAGFDQFGNAVELAQDSLTYHAPTQAGVHSVCYAEGAAEACLDVTVVADALATIALAGPAQLVAGTSGTYALSGFDQHGNPVPLAQESILFEAPTSAGPATVSYAEGDVTGTLAIEIVADALASIVVSGPGSMPAGSTAAFGVSGFDQFGNAVELAATSVLHTAGQAVGTETVSYTEQGITGSTSVNITAVALDLAVATERTSYTLEQATSEGVRGTVTVRFPGDGTIAGANVRVVLLRQVQFVGYLQNETYTGTTGPDGTFTFTASTAFSAPGEYVVIVQAQALGHHGSTSARYQVRL